MELLQAHCKMMFKEFKREKDDYMSIGIQDMRKGVYTQV